MDNYKIIEYSTYDAKQVTDLFYDAVYSINPSIYTPQQKKVWAPKPIDYKKWSKRLAEKKPYLIMFDGLIAGFIELEEDGHIDCFYVKPAFQKQGVGYLLLNFVIKVAQERALKQLYVEASIVAKPLFEKLGFMLTKENKIIRDGLVLTNYTMHIRLAIS